MAKELNEKSLKDRLEVLENDITKVSEQMVSLDKQKSDAIAMLNALNGAKQQCNSFLTDLNNDEPESSDSGDVGNNADSNIPQNKKNVMGLL